MMGINYWIPKLISMNKGERNATNQNGRVMDPKSGLDQVCDVLVQDGKLSKLRLKLPRMKPSG